MYLTPSNGEANSDRKEKGKTNRDQEKPNSKGFPCPQAAPLVSDWKL
jgi:hypothetical protein